MLTRILAQYPAQFRKKKIPAPVLHEAKRRVLDSLGCYFGAFDFKPNKILRQTFLPKNSGEASVWGTPHSAPADLAAWVNGAGVRTLDYNDTYLSQEPCHPSDLLASLWAACEISGQKKQGLTLLKSMVLAYEVMCRLCDAKSIRVQGWDHVTYLPIASAVGCSYIFGLSPEKVAHAVSLSVVGNNALRQTRVGRISDWKAACASYAAKTGLWAVRAAQNGLTGPDQIFTGKNGFFNQVSGPFSLSRQLNSNWMILKTHTKYFPAEHHAQSAIEAALKMRPFIRGQAISKITLESFDVAVDIIGSEKEKWQPTTRETADHSMPYLVVVALLDGDVNLKQYAEARYLKPDVRKLLNRVQVKRSKRYSQLYPKKLPNKVTVHLKNGKILSQEVLLSKGYAGRPMSDIEIEEKYSRLAGEKRNKLKDKIWNLEKLNALPKI